MKASDLWSVFTRIDLSYQDLLPVEEAHQKYYLDPFFLCI